VNSFAAEGLTEGHRGGDRCSFRRAIRSRSRSETFTVLRQKIIPPLRSFIGAEVFEQAEEGGLEGVVLLPVREAGDELLAQLHTTSLSLSASEHS
jgi:hypothetical protein